VCSWFVSDVIGLLLMIPFILTLRHPTRIFGFIKHQPLQAVIGLVCLISIVLSQLIPKGDRSPFESQYSIGNILFSYYIGFPLALICGVAVGSVGFMGSTMLIGMLSLYRLKETPVNAGDPIDVAQMLELVAQVQIYITVLILTRYILHLIERYVPVYL
jgi:hypothetical protein